MNVINVSYLYSIPEFYALLRLTGGVGIPFFEQKDISFSSGLEELKQSMLVSQAEQSVTVDKISAFLAQAVGQCKQCVCIRDYEYYSGLFYSAAVSIVLLRQGQRWIVTPCQEFGDGLEFMLQKLPIKPLRAEICIQTGQGMWIRPYPTAAAVTETIRTAAQWVRDNEKPFGKDAGSWKQ